MRPPLKGRISSGYGNRIHPITKKSSFHNGVDIVAPIGTDIVAPEAGTITEFWDNVKGGHCLAMVSATGKRYGFAHLSNRLVKLHDHVSEGQVIAEVGNSGASTGAHLHFTVKVADQWTNPIIYFKFS